MNLCKECGQVFQQAGKIGPAQKYCSDICRKKKKARNTREYGYRVLGLRPAPTETIVCAGCDKEFLPKKHDQRACSVKCGHRIRYWENPEFYRAKTRRTQAKTIEAYRTRGRMTWAEARAERGSDSARYRRFREPWSMILSGIRIRSTKLGIPFDLTVEWCKERWTGHCELSGLPFILNNPGRNACSPSIDKIDPKKGYTQANCRFILWALNAFKGVGTDAEMIEIARALIEHNP